MPFDIEGARQAGYSDAEIADHLSKESKFDVAGARTAGYNDADIIKHLSSFEAPKPATAGQRFRAATSGGWSGIANTLGMPVDFGLNVWDLGKAGLGFAQGELTGKPPSAIFDPSDRSKYVGTSEWIKQQLGKGGIPTAPERPDDRPSRWIHNAANIGTGVYLGSAIPGPQARPNPRPTNVAGIPWGNAAANSNASAGVNVNIGSGQAGAATAISGTAQATGRGGGYNFGTVGDDATTGLTAGQEAARSGFPQGRLTPGQATGNKLLQRLEAKLESQPMTAGPFDRIKDTNIREVNRAVARSIGENTDNLSADVLDNAATRMGAVFNNVRDDVERTIDPAQFVSRMQAVRDEFEAISPQLWNHPLVTRLVTHAEQGTATGRDLGNLTSKLSREAHRQMTSPQGDRELGRALANMKDYVDDLVAQGLSGDRLRTYEAAREQYRNLSLLTSRVGAINPSTGNVNSGALANLLQQKDKAGFLFGRNQSDMYNAARFGQAFRPIVGDSGTATRMPLPSPTDFVLSLPFNLATRAYASTPAVNAAARAQAASNAAAQAVAPITRGLISPAMSPGGLLGGANAADDTLWSR
jgi:hypothetical protein